jgi:type I restriction enzyme, S subunit
MGKVQKLGTESQLPKGYKQTEVGVIPEDWNVISINQISEPVRGGSPRPAGSPRYFNGSFIPWLTVAALTNIPQSQLYVTETLTCLTEEGSLFSRTLNQGTLIIANSGATLGIAKILGIKCCANDGIAVLSKIDKSVNTPYLTHYINSKTNYLRDVVATGNGQPNLNTDLIGNIKFPLPPTTEEQEAIAHALSDIDALIESLDRLLTKKRQIKQGAMQELLRFKEDWVEKKLEDVADVIDPHPSHRAPAEVANGIPFIGIGDIGEKGEFIGSKVRTVDEKVFDEHQKRYNLDDELIGLGRVASIGKVVKIKKTALKYVISPTLGVIKGTTVKRNYLLYALNSKAVTDQFTKIMSGSTRSSVGMVVLRKLKIALPIEEAERDRIATILSDMDAEIGSIEAKLTKTRQIKQGMMHELLTGRIRLVR